MSITTTTRGNSHEPEMFGPSFWFTLHNGATVYPQRPTGFYRETMKGFIMGLPIMVPCLSCKEHFYSFLRTTNLDNVVASKENLFKFFVDVHNYVNRRYGKPEMSVLEAKKYYGYNGGNDMKITYS